MYESDESMLSTSANASATFVMEHEMNPGVLWQESRLPSVENSNFPCFSVCYFSA